MTYKLRIADLNPKRPERFDIRPTPAQLEQMRETLDLSALRKVRLEGRLQARGKHDWELTAHIGGTTVQPCGVTLEPVTTRIEEDISRIYLAEWEDPEDSEVEMPGDDRSEPLPATLDLIEVTIEALSLALPLFPRAPDAELGEMIVTEPGTTPLTQDALKPFAGLAALKKKMEE
ncbi:MAG: DUF177 domain-containing protein [Litoreibacter sp.]